MAKDTAIPVRLDPEMNRRVSEIARKLGIMWARTLCRDVTCTLFRGV